MGSKLRAALLAGLLAASIALQPLNAAEVFAKQIQDGLNILASGKTKDYGQALAIAERKLKLNPDDHEALYLKAEYFRYSLKYAEGQKTLAKTIATAEKLSLSQTRLSKYYEAWGFNLLSALKYNEAEKLARKALSLDPTSDNAKLLLAMSLISLKQWQEALSLLNGVSKNIDEALSVVCYRIECLTKLHRYAEALKMLDRAEKLFPQSSASWRGYRITIALDKGHFDEADALLSKVVPKDEALAAQYHQLALAYHARHEDDKELAALSSAIKYSKSFSYRQERSQAYAHKGQHIAALTDISDAIKACPSEYKLQITPALMLQRAHEEMAIGLYNEAIGDLRWVLKFGKNPDAEHLWMKIAECYSKLGDRKNEIDAYSSAIKIKPKPQTLTLRAKEYYSMGDYAAALSDAEAVLKKNPRSMDGLYLQAQCLFGQKKLQAALASVNFVIATYPEMPNYLNLRGEILKKLKRNEEAARDFQKAKQSLKDSGIPTD